MLPDPISSRARSVFLNKTWSGFGLGTSFGNTCPKSEFGPDALKTHSPFPLSLTLKLSRTAARHPLLASLKRYPHGLTQPQALWPHLASRLYFFFSFFFGFISPFTSLIIILIFSQPSLTQSPSPSFTYRPTLTLTLIMWWLLFVTLEHGIVRLERDVVVLIDQSMIVRSERDVMIGGRDCFYLKKKNECLLFTIYFIVKYEFVFMFVIVISVVVIGFVFLFLWLWFLCM